MTYLLWPFRLIIFLCWYTKELLVANVTVLIDNLTPGQNSTPGIAKLQTQCRTDLEVTLLSILITLTPGTLTLGPREVDGVHYLYVHGLYNETPDEMREELHVMEEKMLHAIRPGGLT